MNKTLGLINSVRIFALITLFLTLSMSFSAKGETTSHANEEKYITIQTKFGDTVIELFPDKAPNHVKRIVKLAKEGFYDGLTFHRTIPGFMVQTGCPRGDGTGQSHYPNLKAEFNDIKHVKGVVSMARSNHPNSANSQFFIMLGDSDYLDHKYTAFGKVISGMDNIDKIKLGSEDGSVSHPDKIIKLFVSQQ